MVRGDVAGVGLAPGLDAVADHPASDGGRVGEVDAGRLLLGLVLRGGAAVVDEDVDALFLAPLELRGEGADAFGVGDVAGEAVVCSAI